MNNHTHFYHMSLSSSYNGRCFKVGTENRNTHFIFNNVSEDNVAYEIMWKNTVRPDKAQVKIWIMRIVC